MRFKNLIKPICPTNIELTRIGGGMRNKIKVSQLKYRRKCQILWLRNSVYFVGKKGKKKKRERLSSRARDPAHAGTFYEV